MFHVLLKNLRFKKKRKKQTQTCFQAEFPHSLHRSSLCESSGGAPL